MEKIAVFYGGKSVEHEVSIITALQVLENIDRSIYEVFPVYIDKFGVWWHVLDFMNKKVYKNLQKAKKHKIFLQPGSSQLLLQRHLKQEKIKLDAAINCCHGTEGEDGVLQGVLEALRVPYSGGDVLSSAISMNKIVMKQLFEYFKMPIVKWLFFSREEQINFENISLKYPIFVKPANLGSSVGINKCENIEHLKQAIKIAFEFDEYIILEEGVENLLEINCSVQKIEDKIVPSELESPISWQKFLTYEEKYISKAKSEKKTTLAPKIPNKLKKEIETLSCDAYKKFWLDGTIRIDFLYNKETKQLFINEINSIPGSLSFYLWKPKGLSFKAHITNQIVQAKQKKARKEKNKTNFSSSQLV